MSNELLKATSNINLIVDEKRLEEKNNEYFIDSDKQSRNITLDCLPVEIILRICFFLDPIFIRNLSNVCTRLEHILTDTTFWKSWLSMRINARFPAIQKSEFENDFDWVQTCIDIDEEMKPWLRKQGDSMHHLVIKDVHNGSVDSLLLLKNGELCISGARDRCLGLWHVPTLTQTKGNLSQSNFLPTKMVNAAHTGWIWDLAVNNVDSPTTLYSASWDNTVKSWDLTTGLESVNTFKCGISVLSIVAEDNLFFAGLYSAKILMFDTRTGTSPVATFKNHKGCILAMVSHNKHYLASASEDKTIAIWDYRQLKEPASTIKMDNSAVCPISLSWGDSWGSPLYIGDTKGSVHLINAAELSIVGSYELWPRVVCTEAPNKVTGLAQGKASLVACSDRGEIKIAYMSHPLQLCSEFETRTVDITGLQYQNNTIAIASCDFSLEFWVPQTETED